MIQFYLQIKKNFDPIPKQVGPFAGPVIQANMAPPSRKGGIKRALYIM